MAAPEPPTLAPADAHALPTWRAAYSDRTAALMAAFAELAYLPAGDELTGKLATGGFGAPQVFAVDQLQAFLTVNPGEFAVLAFQGTCNPSDWGVDLNALRCELPDFAGVDVHRGFWRAWQALAGTGIKAAVGALPDDLGLYITGHSLGGALAQIAAAELERNTLAACYTFGSPRVATAAFDEFVKCPHYRLINDNDLVPGVPVPSTWGYQHTGDARLLKGPAPTQILRRSRFVLLELGMDVWSGLTWLLTHKLVVIDDHMIWNYRRKLEGIALARNAPAVGAAAGSLTRPSST